MFWSDNAVVAAAGGVGGGVASRGSRGEVWSRSWCFPLSAGWLRRPKPSAISVERYSAQAQGISWLQRRMLFVENDNLAHVFGSFAQEISVVNCNQ